MKSTLQHNRNLWPSCNKRICNEWPILSDIFPAPSFHTPAAKYVQTVWMKSNFHTQSMFPPLSTILVRIEQPLAFHHHLLKPPDPLSLQTFRPPSFLAGSFSSSIESFPSLFGSGSTGWKSVRPVISTAVALVYLCWVILSLPLSWYVNLPVLFTRITTEDENRTICLQLELLKLLGFSDQASRYLCYPTYAGSEKKCLVPRKSRHQLPNGTDHSLT